MNDQCKQCGGNHYITKMQSTRVANNSTGDTEISHEKVQANCPSCTQSEPIELQKGCKDFNNVFLKEHVEPYELRERGLL
jgi:hypothetical protein